MVRHGGSSAGLYLVDPTSPISSHCASIVVTSTFRVNIQQRNISFKMPYHSVCHFCFSMASPEEKIPAIPPKSLTSPSSQQHSGTTSYKTLPPKTRNHSLPSPISQTLPRKEKSYSKTPTESRTNSTEVSTPTTPTSKTVTSPSYKTLPPKTKNHSTSKTGPVSQTLPRKDKTATKTAAKSAALASPTDNTLTSPTPPKCSCNNSEPEPPKTLKCCLKKCIQGELRPSQARVEVRAFILKESEKAHMEVAWRDDGEAVFHDICWKAMLDSYKMENPFQVILQPL